MDGKSSMLDETTQDVEEDLRPLCDWIGEFHGGLALAKWGPGLRFIREDGKAAHGGYFDFAEAFHSDGDDIYAIVGVGFHFFHIGSDCKPLYEEMYIEAREFDGGKAWVKRDDGKWAQIDTKGKVVTKWRKDCR